VASKKQDQPARRKFYARLPAATYKKLRRLAKMPPLGIESTSQALFVRLPDSVHTKLRQIASRTPGATGVVASMRNALCSLIADAKSVEVKGRRCMASVCIALIQQAKLTRAKG